jgi:hypothetical protein
MPAATPLSELIGTSGFGVVVKGESLAAHHGIHDGDVAWIRPGAPYTDADLCLTHHPDIGLYLTTPAEGFCIIGRVMVVTSMRVL